MKHLLNQSEMAKGTQNDVMNSQTHRKAVNPYANDPYADVYISCNEHRKLAAGKIFRPRALL